MSRPSIFAEQFADDTVADALREHREDRARLLTALTTSWEQDERIRAAWLWGSFGRNEADDLSDLDPWLLVTDEAAAEMGPSLRHYAEQTGSLISGKNVPQHAPAGGGYISFLHGGRHGLLQVDCYWQPQSTLTARSETTRSEYAVLFDRQAEAGISEGYPNLVSAKEAGGLQAEVEHGLEFAWFMFSITAKSLARDPASDMGLMFYPKPGLEEAAEKLGQADMLTPEDWAVPDEPLEKINRLRHLAGKAEQLRLVANSHGCSSSPLYTSCLSRYLDMVIGILQSSARLSL